MLAGGWGKPGYRRRCHGAPVRAWSDPPRYPQQRVGHRFRFESRVHCQLLAQGHGGAGRGAAASAAHVRRGDLSAVRFLFAEVIDPIACRHLLSTATAPHQGGTDGSQDDGARRDVHHPARGAAEASDPDLSLFLDDDKDSAADVVAIKAGHDHPRRRVRCPPRRGQALAPVRTIVVDVAKLHDGKVAGWWENVMNGVEDRRLVTIIDDEDDAKSTLDDCFICSRRYVPEMDSDKSVSRRSRSPWSGWTRGCLNTRQGRGHATGITSVRPRCEWPPRRASNPYDGTSPGGRVELAPGTTVERYPGRARARTGRHGHGVYAVKHTLLGTRHALKVLHDPRAGARLLRERPGPGPARPRPRRSRDRRGAGGRDPRPW